MSIELKLHAGASITHSAPSIKPTDPESLIHAENPMLSNVSNASDASNVNFNDFRVSSYTRNGLSKNELDPELKYYAINFVHYVLFGNGENKYLILPIVIGTYFIVSHIIQYRDLIRRSDTSFYVELVVTGCFSIIALISVYYGVMFCRNNQLKSILLASIDKDSKESTLINHQKYLNILNSVYIISFIFCFGLQVIFANPGMNDFLQKSYNNNKKFDSNMSVASMFYTLFISIIVNSMYLFEIYVVQSTYHDVVMPNLQLGRIDQLNEIMSNYIDSIYQVGFSWKYYNLLRTIPMLLISVYSASTAKAFIPICHIIKEYLRDPYISESMKVTITETLHHIYVFMVYNIILGLLVGGAILFSVLYTGLFNDEFHRISLRYLSDMLMKCKDYYTITNHTHTTSLGISRDEKKLPQMKLEDAQNLLRDFIVCIPAREAGIGFGGIEIRTQKALTLLSIFVYILSTVIEEDLTVVT
jgi:hypothetical protein